MAQKKVEGVGKPSDGKAQLWRLLCISKAKSKHKDLVLST